MIEERMNGKTVGNGIETKSGRGTDLTNYRISSSTIDTLKKIGIVSLFPIQQETFNLVYDQRDVMGRDITGSGKTLAYALPLVERFRAGNTFNSRLQKAAPTVLVMLPTRELAIQVSSVFNQLRQGDDYRVLPVYGGSSVEAQAESLRQGIDVVVGTTGRILDHLERGTLKTHNLKCVVLDEADRMLDMGFQEDVEKIFEVVNKQPNRAACPLQCLLFSATFPYWVQQVARKFLNPSYTLVDLAKNLANKTASSVKHLSVYCPYINRTSTLADIILCYGGTFGKTIVFTQTKAEANELYLSEKLKDIEVLHGDIPQQQREVTFKGFNEGRFHILVATDVASRGLDIPNVDLIVQCEPPKDVETYIHRSGRTARAGKEGTVITFYSKKNICLLNKIEKMAGITFSKIGVPQPKDIIKASSKFILEGLKKVKEEALPLFEETADALVKEFGEHKALLLTLAYLSGNLNKIKKRSLLTGTENLITYAIETKRDFRTVSYVWGILKGLLPNENVQEIRQMSCYKNNMGAAFDIPENLTCKLEAEYERQLKEREIMSYSIKKVSELPELKEFEPFSRNFERRPNGFGERSDFGFSRISRRPERESFRNAIRVESRSRSRSQSRSSSNRSRSSSNRSRSRSRSRSHSYRKLHCRRRSHSRDHYTSHHTNNFNPRTSNDIFIWGLQNEEEIKNFCKDNRLSFTKIKVLMNERGESKLCAFVGLEPQDIDQALKLNGVIVKHRRLKISLASDKLKT